MGFFKDAVKKATSSPLDAALTIGTGGLYPVVSAGGLEGLFGNLSGSKGRADLSLVTPTDPSAFAQTGVMDMTQNSQDSLVRELQRRLAGDKSLAAMQAQAAGEQNLRNALSMAVSSQGVDPALALRQAQLAQGQQQAVTGQNAAMATLAEQQQAAQLLGGAIGQQQNFAERDRQAQIERQRLEQQRMLGQLAAQTQTDVQGQKNRGDLFGKVMSGIGTAIMPKPTPPA